MSTLAIACAQDDGLDIVGDERSGDLHRCLLEKELNSVYESWLGIDINMEPPPAASGEELMEFIVGMVGNPSKLSIDGLRSLAAEREPIDALIAELRKEAIDIPRMNPGIKRDEAFQKAVGRIMARWEGDRNNLSSFGRSFFGRDSAKLATTFVSSVADKTITRLLAGIGRPGSGALGSAITAKAINFSWNGAIDSGGIIVAGAGLIIGVIAHAGITYHDRAKRAKNSPYRFLTTLESAGVLCRF